MTAVKKRVSKKNKKSWRKNVDITDVENFLEDQRLEERLGIKFSDTKNEDLFEIDVKGQSDGIELSSIKTNKKPRILLSNSNNTSSFRLRETELPKCYEILEKRSAVPVPIKPTKRIKAVENKYLRRKAKIKKATEANNKQNDKEENKPVKKFSYDIWSDNGKHNQIKKENEWVKIETLRHNLQNIGQHKKVIPKSIHSKTSKLAAIDIPHPGLSYNPSLKDHKEILSKAAEKEYEIIKEKRHLNRVTKEMFSSVSREEMEKNWIKEMSVGLTVSKSDSDDDDGQEYKALNPPVRNKKKTLQKKRKKREALVLKEKLKNQKIEKKKISDIQKVKKFNESILKKEQKIMEKMEKKKEKKKKKPYTTRVLSKIKYQDADIDFQLPEELSGNLRNINSVGSILHDRFKSLQKRNILAPTIKRHHKKAKVKKYERNHTKMDWEKNDTMSSFKKILKK